MKSIKWQILILCLFLLGMSSASHPALTFDQLRCLSKERIAAVRASPTSIKSAFIACQAELNDSLARLNLSGIQTRQAFVSILAHSMAPYGTSRAITLHEILREEALDCDNYVLLTGYFNRIFLGDAASPHFVGLDGGAIGNHAQLIIKSDDGELLLDPTIGLVAKVGFNELLAGKPIEFNQFRIFRQHPDQNIDAFAQKVADALVMGKYRPSDLLYYFSSLDDYVLFSKELAPLWNSDVDALIRRFPTPGARTLRQKLVGATKK